MFQWMAKGRERKKDKVRKRQRHREGSGCGSVGRAVASDTRGPRFESSHRQNIYIEHISISILVFCQLHWKDEKRHREKDTQGEGDILDKGYNRQRQREKKKDWINKGLKSYKRRNWNFCYGKLQHSEWLFKIAWQFKPNCYSPVAVMY